MARQSELAGIAHDIAHHSGSGLSYLNPHLAIALRSAGMESAEIDLLTPAPYPPVTTESEPLRLALARLHEFTVNLLRKHGFGVDEVSGVTLFASPAPWDADGYLLHTRTVITSRKGRKFDSGWLA